MIDEIGLIRKVREELKKLGFSDLDILTNYRISGHYRADVVILVDNQPFLIVELKTPKFTVAINSDTIKFDPSVRQVQTYANASKAPFFAIYNGERFFWFTSDSVGRPQLINGPMLARIAFRDGIDLNFKLVDEILHQLIQRGVNIDLDCLVGFWKFEFQPESEINFLKVNNGFIQNKLLFITYNIISHINTS